MPVSLVLFWTGVRFLAGEKIIQIMPKPNYSFEKRKREMDKKAKKAEKAKRKAEEDRNPSAGGDSGQNSEQTPPAANP